MANVGCHLLGCYISHVLAGRIFRGSSMIFLAFTPLWSVDDTTRFKTVRKLYAFSKNSSVFSEVVIPCVYFVDDTHIKSKT